MARQKVGDFTGYSDSGINEAIQDALSKAGDYVRVEVIETRGSETKGNKRHYQVTIATFNE